jgi:alpha-galactosidase
MPEVRKGKWNRREAIGLAASAIAVVGCKPAARESAAAAIRLANQTSLLGASDSGGGVLRLASLKSSASQFEWLAQTQAAAPAVAFGAQAQGDWKAAKGASTQSTLAFQSRTDAGLESTLLISSYEDSGAFRWQQAYRNTGAGPTAPVSAYGVIDLTLRADLGPLVVHCIRRDSDYFREALPFRGHLGVKGGGWNAPSHAGLFIIEAVDHGEFLVLGVQHEREWTLTLDSITDGTKFAVTLSNLEHPLAPGQALEAPPIYLGAVRGALDDAVNLSLGYLRGHVLPASLENTPWIGYDIWSTDAANVEKNILDEVKFAADLGIDLFYLDASWYKNSSRRGTGDWGKGLGSYEADRLKFPSGLRHLSDTVHAADMKFGLWVGPNIVDIELVGRDIPSQWLAQENGKPRELSISSWEHKCVQVCLGCTDYAEHLKKELTRLIRDYDLDWLKWDNSGLPGVPALCTSGDHGHAPGDGSSAALANEYAIFKHLHDTFPKLTLEQCGYGSRIDFGRAEYVRANWCSDKTFPSESVRSNAMACATVFPSAWNAAWIVREDQEFFSYKETHQIDAGIRSRMLGMFGVGTLNGQMSQRASLYPTPVIERLKANVPIYKQYRHLLSQQVSFPFQPYGRSPQGWDAVQFTKADSSEAVLLCFRGASTQTQSVLKLGRLKSMTNYRVRRVDANTEEKVSGAELMKAGLLVELTLAGASEVVLVDAVA